MIATDNILTKGVENDTTKADRLYGRKTYTTGSIIDNTVHFSLQSIATDGRI